MEHRAGDDLTTPTTAPLGDVRGLTPAGAPPRRATAREEALEACFESADVGLLVASPSGVVLRANAAFAALLGMPPNEVAGRSVVELTHPEDRAFVVNTLQAIAARRVRHVEVEKRLLRKDGGVVWVRVTAVPGFAPDGTPIHQLVTVRDLTEERELTSRLHEMSLRFQRLVDANIIGVAVATGARVLEANDEYLRLAGVTREQFAANGLDWLAITPAEHRPKDMQGLEDIRERGACLPFEKEYVHPGGARAPILVGGALLEREPLKWIAFALDLSERRRAERERDQLLEEAHAARDVAEAALAARDALLARVTHDLRTPISANVGYASIMLDGSPERLPEAHEVRLRRMRANQEHMLALLDELLDFARHAAGRSEVVTEEVQVGELLDGIEPLLAPQIRAAGITFSCPPCDSTLRVRADRVRATQILTNLVSNAIKFTPPGGQVTVRARADGERGRIDVADTGVGIAAHQLGRIFEPFVQGDVLQQRRGAEGQRGFGLGLAISRELARRMGGDLTVESEPGRGSVFTLTLALA